MSSSQKSWIDYIPLPVSDNPTHPLQIALRTYALSLSLSLGPSLIPFVSSRITSKPSPRTSLQTLKRVLRREFGLDGFAFATTVCVGGGAAISHLWDASRSPNQQTHAIPGPPKSAWTIRKQIHTYLQAPKLTSYQKTFLANMISSSFGILLLQAGYQRSRRLRRGRGAPDLGVLHSEASTQTNGALPTLDLTLLLLVRAVDALLQAYIHDATRPARLQNGFERNPFPLPTSTRDTLLKEDAKPTKLVHNLTSRIDAFVFWACSARYIPYYCSCTRHPLTSASMKGDVVLFLQTRKVCTIGYHHLKFNDY
jgi:hypothetical protein